MSPFEHCQLSLTNWHQLTAKQTAFTDCDLSDADFSEAKLTKTTFSGSRLEQASFLGTSLKNLDLSESIFKNLGVQMGDLYGVKLDQERAARFAQIFLNVKISDPTD